MKNFCLLIGGLLLYACAPAATSNSTANTVTGVANPLKPGDVYVIKGSDQSGQAFEGRLTLSRANTEYDAARQLYYIDADNGFLIARSGGVIEQAWLDQGDEAVVCVPYIGESQLPYQGRALRGSAAEITALINRFRASDNTYYGISNCVISTP